MAAITKHSLPEMRNKQCQDIAAQLQQPTIKLQLNLNTSNTDGRLPWLIQTNSPDSSRGRKYLRDFSCFIVNCILLYSLESPNRSDSNEYTQCTIIVRKIEKISLNYRHLLLDLAP